MEHIRRHKRNPQNSKKHKMNWQDIITRQFIFQLIMVISLILLAFAAGSQTAYKNANIQATNEVTKYLEENCPAQNEIFNEVNLNELNNYTFN